jgi:hypothetical protein
MANSDPRDEERSDPTAGEAGGGSGSGSGDDLDALGRLEEQLGRASEAAERLFTEAGAAARGRRTPPPSGWQVPQPEGPDRQSPPGTSELESLLAALASLRERIPPDLQRRLADALRELLTALRALIDWYLERSKEIRSEPSEVQDIPIS